MLIVVLATYFLFAPFAHSETTETTHPQPGNLLEALQGRWQFTGGRHTERTNASGLSYQSPGVTRHKIYVGNYFYSVAFSRDKQGHAVYGGKVEVIDENTLRETILFYGPYDQKSLMPTYKRGATFVSGESLVGSIATLNIRFQNEHLAQVGSLKQSIQKEGYRDIEISQYYTRIDEGTFQIPPVNHTSTEH